MTSITSHKRLNVIGYLILTVGVALGIYLDTADIQSGHKLDKRTRGVVCTILKQSDQQTYEFANSHPQQIDKAELEKALRASARYRGELAPAPNCTSQITKFNPKVIRKPERRRN